MRIAIAVLRLSAWICLGLLALVFVSAGLGKLFHVSDFARTIADFGLVTPGFERPLAIGLPLLEIGSAIALVLGLRGALALITAQLLLFVAVLVYGLWLGLDVDCGCFGPGEAHGLLGTSLESALVRDLILLGLCAYVALSRRLTAARLARHRAGRGPDETPLPRFALDAKSTPRRKEVP